MLIFVTALLAEAKPLISHYKLKKDLSLTSFPVYQQGDIRLVVTGVGKVKSAIATSWLLSQINSQTRPILVNLGFCGSNLADYQPGQLLIIGKITDLDSKQDFYPDLPASNKLPVSSCFCASRQVLATSPAAREYSGCFDMESAGFFQAASVFTTVERIILLKMLSDQLEEGRLDLAGLELKLKAGLPELEKIWLPLKGESGSELLPDTAKLEEVISRLAQKQRFTAGMRRQLEGAARAAQALGRDPLPLLEASFSEAVTHKREGLLLLERLLQELKDETEF